MEELTKGELKIVRALKKLEKLWVEHGSDLLLFNGNSLRKGGQGQDAEIHSFLGIKGDGGDGGDVYFE